MQDLYKDLSDICATLTKELSKTNDKIDKSGGEISAGDIDYIDKLTHAIKSVKTTKAMIEADNDGYSGYYRMPYYDYMRSYDDGESFSRGHGTYAKRDSMGRYSKRSGYSMNADTISQLENLMDDVEDESVKQDIKKVIHKMKNM